MPGLLIRATRSRTELGHASTSDVQEQAGRATGNTMASSNDPSNPGAEMDNVTTEREVRFEHSTNFAPLLSHLGISLLVSTYQAGKLVAVGSQGDTLTLSFHNFERAMGLALDGMDRIALGATNQVWLLRNARDLAPRIEPAGKHDACFLARSSRVTGDIQAHEMAWAGDELWITNTLFSCLCTLHEDYSFVPRWRPPFVSALAAEDRCHLNGLALENGCPRYVTVFGETDTPRGWRPTKASSGCLVDVPRPTFRS